jgi:hypothetical protein
MHDPFYTILSTTHYPQIQELTDIHFNVYLLHEDCGIIFLQTYIHK